MYQTTCLSRVCGVEMKQRQSDKHGVVFSLDAAIAVTVLIIVLINSAYYLSTSSRESLSQLQPVRLGSDILRFLSIQEI